jgi:hypothetical protein
MPHKDPAKKAEYAAAWQAANREKRRAYQKEWRNKDPERREKLRAYLNAWRAANRDRMRAHYRKRSTGWTEEQYREKLEKQGGRCAICGTDQCKTGKAFAADHCHETGRKRGVLCKNCNTGLGQLGDNQKGVLKALAYLIACELEYDTQEDTNDANNTREHHHTPHLLTPYERSWHELRDLGPDDHPRDLPSAMAVGAGAGETPQLQTGERA